MSSTALLPDDFLSDYWQQKACLIRGNFSAWTRQISLDRAALIEHAGDARLSSRLVRGNSEQNNWQVAFGAFTAADLQQLPDNDWTLLVQDLDKVRSDCRALLESFDLLPRWRLDDVMASVAAPGGSVGPHVDQYDVFLLQLAGQRHWQWSREFNPQLLEDQPLAVLQHFEPHQQATLKPGDLLYLPPGVAHHGVATGSNDCITLSIGCRAPSAAELLHALAEHLHHHQANQHYQDPHTVTASSELSTEHVVQLRNLLQMALEQSDTELLSVFGHLLSEYRLADELLEWPAPEPFTAQAPQRFERQPAARLVWLQTGDDQALLFCHGQSLACSAAAAALVCEQPHWSLQELHQLSPAADELLHWLLDNAAIQPLDGC